MWTETVTSGTYDAPRKVAALYAEDAVLWGTEVCGPDDDLWGTVSESVRDSPPQIYAYFVSVWYLLNLVERGAYLLYTYFLGRHKACGATGTESLSPQVSSPRPPSARVSGPGRPQP